MSAQPYTPEEVESRRNTRPHPLAHVIDPRIVEFNEERRRWLATVDALTSRLDAATRERDALADKAARWDAHEARRFPIQYGTPIPWAMIEPFDYRAQRNHGGQTLEQLAERGGLGNDEAIAVLEERDWRPMDPANARERLRAMVDEWESKRRTRDAATRRAEEAEASEILALRNNESLRSRLAAMEAALKEARGAVLERFYQADLVMPGSLAKHYSGLLAKIDALLKGGER